MLTQSNVPTTTTPVPLTGTPIVTTPNINSSFTLSPSSTSILNTQSSISQPQSNQTTTITYLSKVISGLIAIFEANFSKQQYMNSTICCIEIFKILVTYIDNYYASTSSLSPMSSSSSSVLQPKYFNYYASIRKDVFEFLLRIRSDSHKKCLLVNRNNRRTSKQSQYLMLTLNETKIYSDNQLKDTETNGEEEEEESGCDDLSNLPAQSSECQIDMGRILRAVESCLEKETDWCVLMRVLADLPYALQYEMNLVKNSNFINRLIKHFYKKDLKDLRNKPDNLSKLDYMNKYYPLMASLVLYHPVLERTSHELILQNFVLGINPTRNRYCLEILTIAIVEMHETNALQCGEILLKLSQFSPSPHMALPVLELLSTMSEFKRIVDFIFGRKELYISVFAIAIKYTNPIKFDSFIVQLAHYVICIWFLKSKQEIRKNCASFICKGLHKEVIHEIELLKTKQNLENTSSEQQQPPKRDLSDILKVFYKELVEITIDFMSNNMFSEANAYSIQFNSKENRSDFFVDIYSNLTYTNTSSNYLRSSSLINHDLVAATLSGVGGNLDSSGSSGQLKSVKGLSRQWLVGNKIIQVKTGLFSNICLEDAMSHLNSKSKSNSISVNTQQPPPNHHSNQSGAQHLQSKPMTKTAAIDIPSANFNNSNSIILNNHSLAALAANIAHTNDSSVASSNASSTATSISNNNSFSSVSLNSNFNSNNNQIQQQHHHQANLNSILNLNTNEKDIFDVTIEDSSQTTQQQSDLNEDLTSQPINEVSSSVGGTGSGNGGMPTNTNTTSSSNLIRRSKLKRRYKSGLPLTNNVNENETREEFNLRQYYDYAMSKHSKDDSGIYFFSKLLILVVLYSPLSHLS